MEVFRLGAKVFRLPSRAEFLGPEAKRLASMANRLGSQVKNSASRAKRWGPEPKKMGSAAKRMTTEPKTETICRSPGTAQETGGVSAALLVRGKNCFRSAAFSAPPAAPAPALYWV